MANSLPKTRKAYRRTDDYSPGTPKVKLVTEDLPQSIPLTACLIKVHAVSLNYRDANIANGGNPWWVLPNGILCNDGAGEVIAVGDKVRFLKPGDRVAPNTDTKQLTSRSQGRSWLAADEDGVLADYIVFDEEILSKLPSYLDWVSASLIPCAGVTAWSALRDFGIGKSVLIQGTGGVSSFALKLARAAGLTIVLTSSSDEKLEKMKKQFPHPPLLTVNYAKNPNWHEDVLKITNGVGVDLVVENGGTGSLVKSMKCTKRGGTISQVGYLGKQNPQELAELISTSIDRRIIWRGINAGSKEDMDDLCAALSSTKMQLDDIIDQVYSFENAEEAIQRLWEGKVVGKLVIRVGT